METLENKNKALLAASEYLEKNYGVNICESIEKLTDLFDFFKDRLDSHFFNEINAGGDKINDRLWELCVNIFLNENKIKLIPHRESGSDAIAEIDNFKYEFEFVNSHKSSNDDSEYLITRVTNSLSEKIKKIKKNHEIVNKNLRYIIVLSYNLVYDLSIDAYEYNIIKSFLPIGDMVFHVDTKNNLHIGTTLQKNDKFKKKNGSIIEQDIFGGNEWLSGIIISKAPIHSLLNLASVSHPYFWEDLDNDFVFVHNGIANYNLPIGSLNVMSELLYNENGLKYLKGKNIFPSFGHSAEYFSIR